MDDHGMPWHGRYDYGDYSGGYNFSYRKEKREVTQMEYQRVELISKRNMANHLRATQQVQKPVAKVMPNKIRPVARNKTRN